MHEEYKEMIKKAIEYIENHLHEEPYNRKSSISQCSIDVPFSSYFSKVYWDECNGLYSKEKVNSCCAGFSVDRESLLLILQCNMVFPHKRHLRGLLKECFNCRQRNIESTSSHFI